MKNPFFKKLFKSLVIASVAVAVSNCGDEDTAEIQDNLQEKKNSSVYIVNEASFIYNDGNVTYLVAIDGIVRDTLGNIVGAADLTTGTIVAMDQVVIATGVDFSTLETAMPTVVKDNAWILNADQVYVIYTDGTVTDANGTLIGTIQFVEGTFIGTITKLDGTPLVENLDVSTLQQATPNVTSSDSGSGTVVNDPTGNDTGSTGDNGGDNGGSTPTAKSSSSTAKSSSSTAKSSSSTAKSSSSTGGSTGSSYTIKYVNGGKSGSGYATRYWDCCKPHCAWPEHGGTASSCDASGNKIGDKSASSMCDGGNAGICRGQFPIVVNDTLAFAFAATPGGENNCGKCFDLAFTGKGKYATDNHGKLKGKHLIVMSSNVGYDVEGGQFDVMIPGGGFGIFDGCSSRMGWGSQGKQYGGLLSECEDETGYTASKYKSCLTEKCNKSFSSDAQAKEGCLFMANWMNAAGNPLLQYKEVECPQELKDRY